MGIDTPRTDSQRMKGSPWRLWLLLAGALLAVVAGVLGWIFFGPNTFDRVSTKTVFVSKGQRFAEIADSLESQGVIRSREFFVFVAKVYGGTSRLQVGKYLFQSGASNSEIYLSLRSGEKNQLISVMIPEGYLVRSQARLLANALHIDSARFVSLARDSQFVRSLGIEAGSLEGYLLPQTYAFYWQQDEKDVVRAMVENFLRFFDDSLRDRAAEIGMSMHQVVTLASIVEGEVLLDEERPVVSGVYHNRLRRGMRLEADPTIQYILPDGPRRILYADLNIDNPYNTYRNRGLPPGPVNNPGSASILATLYPAHHTYLFFVANGRGGHWFSTTYTEHRRYVRIYRRERSRAIASPPAHDQGQL